MKAKIIETKEKIPVFKDVPTGGLFCERLTGTPYMKIQSENFNKAVNLEYGYISTFESDAEIIKVLDYRLELSI